MGDNPVSPEVEAALRARFNLDGSLWDQYTGYVQAVLSGDFGRTTDGRNVSRMLELAWPVTLLLAATAWILELVIGLGIGIASALLPGRLVDRLGWALTLLSLAVPTFAVALLLQHYVGLGTGLFPVAGTRAGWPMAYILPAAALALVGFGSTARLTRVSVANTMDSEFVRLARARGISGSRVIFSYILRPGIIPLVTHLGVSFAGMLGGAVIVEAIFNLGGVGGLIVNAVSRREGSTIVGLVTILVVLVAVINIVIDLAYRFLDPRLRTTT
ncbi:ABC transporter permease [Micromonospora pallida]|uniref:ABC transporter permease n=1 Tax=Micromonospora pallida TaxID=145854 RepID=UPI00159F00BF|nr:ABC transporter permease [Micromonospora pallida]